MKFLTATGEILTLGGESTEGIGPDLAGLFVGSEGLFGIALEITLRLIPKVPHFYTVMAGYHSLEQAGDAVSNIVASNILPGALEIMDRLAMDAADAAVQAGYPAEARAILIVELEGPISQVEEEKSVLTRVLENSGAFTVQVAKNSEERLKIWKGRKCAFSAVGRLSPDFIVQDGVVPRRKLGEALREIEKIAQQHGTRVANVFHAGDGNLHPLIMFRGSEIGALERAEATAAEILRLCIRLGGSITGEHGVGVEKREFLSEMFSEADIHLMKIVRRAFDPQELANPGKMFPAGQAPALTHTGLHPLEKEGKALRH
jgi:glycolate oxidase